MAPRCRGRSTPGGLPATYAFELGVYEGAGTQYGIVFSGPAGTGSVPVEETLALSGLAPGTTYAYRITVSSGYVPNASHTLAGAASTFTTAGLPGVLQAPAPLVMLAIPNIAFPPASVPTTVKPVVTKASTSAQKLAAALKACRQQKPKAKRTKCEASARRKDGPAKRAKGAHKKN